MEWKPRYVVKKADHVGGPPIPDDEPCLVIRAQDVLALEMIDHYLSRYYGGEFFDKQVCDELVNHRANLVAWRRAHRDKIKTADR